MGIEEVYQQTLLEYSRKKEHKRDLCNATGAERGHNPSCGDDLTLLLKQTDGIVKDIAFLGVGCAVSTASTNMLIEIIKGKTVKEARRIIDIFFAMMSNDPVDDIDLAVLEDAQMFAYFANMPARIKCATLSWHSAKVLLEQVE